MDLRNAKVGEYYKVYIGIVNAQMSVGVSKSPTAMVEQARVLAIHSLTRNVMLGWKTGDNGAQFGTVLKGTAATGPTWDYVYDFSSYSSGLIVTPDYNVHARWVAMSASAGTWVEEDDYAVPVTKRSAPTYGHRCSNPSCSVGFYPDAEHDATKGAFVCTGCKLWKHVWNGGDDTAPITKRDPTLGVSGIKCVKCIKCGREHWGASVIAAPCSHCGGKTIIT